MLSYALILLFASVFPVYLIGKYIYNRDRDKEPFDLLKKLFVGGALSCFAAMILESIISAFFPEENAMNLWQLLLYTFLCIGLVEESCKLTVVKKYAYDNENFDYFYDGIVYAVFASLGFACFENIGYVFEYGLGVAFTRGILSVPGHACFGVFMGYFLSLAKVSSVKNYKGISIYYNIMSLLVPLSLHGIYDYCLMTQNTYFIIAFFIFVIIIFRLGLNKVKNISSMPFKFRYKSNFCPVCGNKVTGNYCPVCGHKNE
jgi:protease PrsW